MDLSEKSCEKLRKGIDLYVPMVYPLLRGRNFDKNERREKTGSIIPAI
jgi:hypothetical protein